MARFLVSTRSGSGHFNPMSCIARELVKRGHEVVWHTTPAYKEKVEALGVRFAPAVHAPDWYEKAPGVPYTEAEQNSKGPEAVRRNFRQAFVGPMAGQIRDYQAITQTFTPDVLLADNTNLGAPTFCEKTGLPHATLNISVLPVFGPDAPPFTLGLPPAKNGLQRLGYRLQNKVFQNVLVKPLRAEVDKVRTDFDLPPLGNTFFMETTYSRRLVIQQGVPEFEYRGVNKHPHIRFVGALMPPPPERFDAPPWWHEVTSGTKPVIHITQGTVATDTGNLLQPTLRALASRDDLLVVATTGGLPLSSLPHPLPANVRAATLIPHSLLLPHTSVMVTNGGMGGVMAALQNGVPLIAAGTTEEKPEVCARVAHSGVGLHLKTSTPTDNQVGEAVDRILSNPSYRERAKHLQEAMAKQDGPREACDALEAML